MSPDIFGYDDSSQNIESFSWCIGSQSYLDLSQFEDYEILFASKYDTYCVKYFCGGHIDCLICEHYKNAKNKY